MELRKERVVKKSGDERRERMGRETMERVGWYQRGTRAIQFKATSSGRDGISCASAAELLCVVVVVDMAVCLYQICNFFFISLFVHWIWRIIKLIKICRYPHF